MDFPWHTFIIKCFMFLHDFPGYFETKITHK